MGADFDIIILTLASFQDWERDCNSSSDIQLVLNLLCDYLPEWVPFDDNE